MLTDGSGLFVQVIRCKYSECLYSSPSHLEKFEYLLNNQPYAHRETFHHQDLSVLAIFLG